jgi:hypothetical protein
MQMFRTYQPTKQIFLSDFLTGFNIDFSSFFSLQVFFGKADNSLFFFSNIYSASCYWKKLLVKLNCRLLIKILYKHCRYYFVISCKSKLIEVFLGLS